ncbi:MAG: SRPBCC family protein [Balneolaceae bacterium]
MNNENSEKLDSPSVKIIKDFGVPAEKVFDAWIDPKWISRWMFGPDVRDEEIIKLEASPKKNGTFSYVVRREGELINHLGTYLEVNRFTWGVEGVSEEESTVTIEIVSTENGCRLTLIHQLDPEWSEYTERTKEGWSFIMDKLKDLL